MSQIFHFGWFLDLYDSGTCREYSYIANDSSFI